MTDLRQAAQQALEAMQTNQYTVAELAPNKVVMQFNKAIAALRTALAQEHALHDLARLGQEIEQAEPLPYEQLDSLWQTTDTGDFELDIREFGRAIEAALKKKNT